MADDIEEFLRRALQRRVERQAPAQPPPPVQRPPDVVYIGDREEPEPIRAMPMQGHDVSEHVAQHLDNREFSDRATHMGENIGQASEVADERIHQAMDHKVGDLDDSDRSLTSVTASIQRTAGIHPADIRRMFTDPQSLKQVILMSELLNRREF